MAEEKTYVQCGEPDQSFNLIYQAIKEKKHASNPSFFADKIFANNKGNDTVVWENMTPGKKKEDPNMFFATVCSTGGTAFDFDTEFQMKDLQDAGFGVSSEDDWDQVYENGTDGQKKLMMTRVYQLLVSKGTHVSSTDTMNNGSIYMTMKDDSGDDQ